MNEKNITYFCLEAYKKDNPNKNRKDYRLIKKLIEINGKIKVLPLPNLKHTKEIRNFVEKVEKVYENSKKHSIRFDFSLEKVVSDK